MSKDYKNILVAIDGSKEAEWALKKAVSIAKEKNAKVYLVHVIDTRTFATVEAYDRTVAQRADKFATELLDKYKESAEQAGITNVETLIEYGSPKVIIPKDLAKEYNIDLIVCGATGLNAVERILIGSVSEHIVRYASCDVLIVRTEKEI